LKRAGPLAFRCHNPERPGVVRNSCHFCTFLYFFVIARVSFEPVPNPASRQVCSMLLTATIRSPRPDPTGYKKKQLARLRQPTRACRPTVSRTDAKSYIRPLCHTNRPKPSINRSLVGPGRLFAFCDLRLLLVCVAGRKRTHRPRLLDGAACLSRRTDERRNTPTGLILFSMSAGFHPHTAPQTAIVRRRVVAAAGPLPTGEPLSPALTRRRRDDRGAFPPLPPIVASNCRRRIGKPSSGEARMDRPAE